MIQPVNLEEPKEGYYRCKLIRGGPWQPVRIWVDHVEDRPSLLLATLNGKDIDPYQVYARCYGHQIQYSEYLYLTSLNEYAVKHAPDMPEAKPGEPVNFGKLKPPEWT